MKQFDYIVALVPVFLLCTILLSKVRYSRDRDEIFSYDDCKVMRGFWCIVIILVHVPVEFGNPIQNMIGSFAYIGVTFFFLTSGYGLALEREKTSRVGFLKSFWLKRLPKILLTSIASNLIVFYLWKRILNADLKISFIWSINSWVIWLLICYFIFWISNLISEKNRAWKILCILQVTVFSIVIYYMTLHGRITDTVWVVEIYGFIWGIVLSCIRREFVLHFKTSWKVKLISGLGISLILGIFYIEFKWIIFWGDYLLKIILGLMIIVSMLIANLKISLGGEIGKKLGEISFEIYLIHMWMFSPVSKILPDISSGLYIMVCIAASVIVAFFDHLIVKYIMKTLKNIELKKG